MRPHLASRCEHGCRTPHQNDKYGINRSECADYSVDAEAARSDEERLNREQNDPASHHRRMNVQKCCEFGCFKEYMEVVSAREPDKHEKYDRCCQPSKQSSLRLPVCDWESERSCYSCSHHDCFCELLVCANIVNSTRPFRTRLLSMGSC